MTVIIMTELMKQEHGKQMPDAFVALDAEYYLMDHPRRGLTVIFNQENFLDPQKNRPGSSVDRDRLAETFQRLGFDIEIFSDLSSRSIENVIRSLLKRDFSESDCFVMIFMSHGVEGKLLTRDGEIDINILWDRFSWDQCPSLINKPKLIFIQACQGGKSEGAATVQPATREGKKSRGEDKVDGIVPSYKIPNNADFLIALSTIPGYVSWRDNDGSFYIQTLCDKLDRDGFNMDILSLMTAVSRKVAIDFEVCVYKSETGTCSKQIPSVISTLIRTLRFTAKEKNSNEPHSNIRVKMSEQLEEEINSMKS